MLIVDIINVYIYIYICIYMYIYNWSLCVHVAVVMFAGVIVRSKSIVSYYQCGKRRQLTSMYTQFNIHNVENKCWMYMNTSNSLIKPTYTTYIVHITCSTADYIYKCIHNDDFSTDIFIIHICMCSFWRRVQIGLLPGVILCSTSYAS